MSYKSVLDVTPKSTNKFDFCKRICTLLEGIKVSDNYIIIYGEDMINHLLKISDFNNGFISITDLLHNFNNNYSSIFELSKFENDFISEEEVLANIDIVVNCLYDYSILKKCEFENENNAKVNIKLLFKTIDGYLLSSGYKLVEDNYRLNIISNDVAIDVEEIKDEHIKDEIINYYDYKNLTNAIEKKKSMLILIDNLDARKTEIGNLMGTNISKTFSNYVNNINLRHNNTSKNDIKHYNPAVAKLSEEELCKWYDYIFVFLFNIYNNLDKLKDININGGYK